MNENPEPPADTVLPSLRYSFSSGTGQRHESHDYVTDFKVRIVGIPFPEEHSILDREIDLGTIEATLIRVARADAEDFPLAYLFDHSGSILDLADALYQPGFLEFTSLIQNTFPYAFPHEDILFIQELSLRPFARGQRAGISALHRFITDWESCCALVAIQPRPMQFMPTIREYQDWDTLALDQLSKDRDASIAKLANHFGGIGFKSVKSIPYMLLNPAKRTAPLAELALEDALTLSHDIIKELP